jgi:hypothetical protein
MLYLRVLCELNRKTLVFQCVFFGQHTSAYVSIRQHTSAYVSIRQHTSAYVRCSNVSKHLFAKFGVLSIFFVVSSTGHCLPFRVTLLPSLHLPTLQTSTFEHIISPQNHTSAYVSIRQHTSAYVYVRPLNHSTNQQDLCWLYVC